MTQDILSDKAQERFLELKKKMNLIIKDSIKDKVDDLTQEKIDKMLDYNHILTKDEIKLARNRPELDEAVSKAGEVQEVFEFIDTLKLPPQLSLAIGLIISGNKTGNTQDLLLAIDAIREVIHG